VDSEELGQDLVADAGGDGERGGDVVDAAAQALPHALAAGPATTFDPRG
jgi:hypothetical protein